MFHYGHNTAHQKLWSGVAARRLAIATIQATDLRITIEPTIPTPEYDFGPSDSVAANAVLLTRENLRKLGAYPPRVSLDWDCNLWVYQVVGGVETAMDLTTVAVTGTYWDPVTRVATTLTVALGAGTGQITVSLDAATATTVAGMFRFQITGTETEEFDLLSGWLEIQPGIPT